jgi:hypothetical protein
MIDVEEARLTALEQHRLSVLERAVDEQRRVVDVRADPLRARFEVLGQLLELQRALAVHALEPEVLLGERDLDFLTEDLRVEQVLDADPESHRLVRVARADAAPGRADLEVAEPAFGRPVDQHVPRHDHVRLA